MRVLLLGTGTCLTPPPGVTARLPPLFAVDLGSSPAGSCWLLFDCSEGARWRLSAAGIEPSSVRHIALSHPHADHAALPPFLQARSCEAIYHPGGDLELGLYLPRASAEALPQLLRWHQPEDDGRPPSRYRLDVTPLDDDASLQLGPGVRLEAFRVHHGHGRSPAVAFRLTVGDKVIAYSGDTGPCEGLLRAAAGADLLICEASSAVGVDMSAYGHLNPRQAAQAAREAGARRLILTHYTGLEPDQALLDDAASSGFTGQIHVGHDGERVDW